MNANLAHKGRRAYLAAPALAGTAASMLLTVAVVALWLGPLLGGWLAVLIGLGFDGAWLAALAYERRLAAVGDHDRRVTLVGWAFGLAATGLLVAHALTAGAGTTAWLAVSWLPVAAKGLWWLHGLWEATEVSPAAREQIGRHLQAARDQAAVARAQLNAGVTVEVIRTGAVAAAGARLAKAQGKAAATLADARAGLDQVGQQPAQQAALEAVAAPAWSLPAWTPVAELTASGGTRAEGTAGIAAQVSAPLVAASAAPSVPSSVPVPVPVSVAAAVRTLMAGGVDDPQEIVRLLPGMTGRPATPGTPSTVARLIRQVRAEQAAQQSPTPSPYL